MSAGSRRVRKGLMMVPAAILLVLVLAEVVPDLALVLIVPLLAPLAVLAARWDTEALERMPVVPLDAVSPAESGVRTHHRLVPAETGEVVRYRSVTWSLLIVRRCLAVGVELRWDEVVVRNPLRTYRLPWRDIAC